MIARMAPEMMRVVAADGDNGTRVEELSTAAAAAAVQCVGQESGSEQRPGRSWARSQLTSFSICLVVLMALSMCQSAQTRYIHATYRFSPANYDDLQPQLAAASNGMEAQPQMSRRQDDESDEADDDDDDPDQRAAASYRNQDDGSGGNGGGGGGDNYGDNESDGPYEETPADQEGQADLERFFDDHLGASDREGMDKENLPTNLVALLSEPPQLMNMNRRPSIQLPAVRELASEQLPHKLTAVPLTPVTNPIVRARETSGLESDQYEQLDSLPTIQTSFIQLPDEKMLITRQVTARNSPHRPLPRPLNLSNEPDNDQRQQTSGQSNTNQSPDQTKVGVNEPSVGLANNLPTAGQQSFGLRISPTEALPSLGPAGNLSPVANEVPVASSSGVVSTEDDEFDRVYVTNEPDKPFKIDALGGFDPEEDFFDAAKDLEVVASDESPGKRNPAATSERSGLKRRSNQEAIVSDESRETSETAPRQRRGGGGGSGELADANQPDHSAGQISSPLQDISFNDPDTDTMYEDASETDEVTFGQDDPYQTDLEAEMRQQEYDKLQSSPGRLTNDQLSSGRGDNLNVVVDNGDNYRPSGATASARQAAASDDNDDDIDSDIDSEYKPDPSSSQQRDSIAPVAASSIGNRPTGRGKQSDADEEGAWVNDGADEMDIPSQSHQNSVLEKAEQRDEAAAAAAARANADETIDKQTPDGGGAGTAEAEGGQTNDNGEENVRMPNADYLKNDFVEDDSGYAS